MLRLFFKVEPENLDDETWADLSAQMWWCLRATGQVEKKDGEYRFIK